MKKLYCIILVIILTLPTFSTSIFADDNQSTSKTISSERYEKGYRYNTNGWIYLHIEGDPYERGYQHGYLLADEIVDQIQRWTNIFPQKWSWKMHRFNAYRFFWKLYPEEYKQEIKGIADGCADRGGKIYDKPVSFKDILTLNEIYEMLTRFRNSNVYPLHLKNNWLFTIFYNVLKSKSDLKSSGSLSEIFKDKCSAFIATGDATVDGRIVASHNTRSWVFDNDWWHLYVTQRWNVMLDIKPSTGYRILMSTAPGMIWSDEDFYQNDKGMILMETTLQSGGVWNRFGLPTVVRARKAIQYSESIDEILNFLIKRNNGLFANEWLIGDTKTGEIASLELAFFNHAIKRTKNGIYWSVNAARDDKVRWELDSIFGLGILGRILSPKYNPSKRDLKFEEFKDEYYGKIDVDIARRIMSTYPICDILTNKVIMYDCKVTDSELVKNFGLWAFMGNPGDIDFYSDEWPINEKRDEYTDLPACGWVQIFGRDKSSIHRDFNIKSKIGKTGEIIWEFQSDEGEIGNAVYSSPISDREKIYFTSWNGNISALDIKTGEKIWENIIGWSSESTPIIVNNKVIVGSSDGLFVLSNKNGDIVWKNEIGGVSTRPLYYDNMVYCGSHDSTFYAFDLETGDINWVFETSGEIHSSPVREGNILYFGSNDGFLYAIDIVSGDLKWKFKTDGPVVSTPLLFNDALYFGSWDSNLYSLNSKTGNLNWKFTAGWGIDCSPIVHDKTVFFGSEDNNFYALDTKDGSLKWAFPTYAGIKSSPYTYGDLVFFGSSDGNFYALDEKDGTLTWSIAPDYHIEGIYNFKTKPIVSSPYVDDGKVFIGSTNGKIYCFNAQTYEELTPIKKEIEIPIDTWLFLVFSLFFVILITSLYLFFDWRKNI
jgi:outer membrane protein assembly factor BamB